MKAWAGRDVEKCALHTEHAALVAKTASFPSLSWGRKWGLESYSRPLVRGAGPRGPEAGVSILPLLAQGTSLMGWGAGGGCW